jgi:putative membrane protein
MTATAGPWAFHPHVAAWLVVAVLLVAYLVGIRRWPGPHRTLRITAFLAGLVVLAVALTWPLADLAAHSLLVALVVQRLLLTLAVPPLLVYGLPDEALAALTRPAPVDAVLRICVRPGPAIAIVTVVAVGSLITPVVDAQASSVAARIVIDLIVLGSGFVLWAPVLHRLPGTGQPSAAGRAGYLIVQAIVPSFLSVIWILARHPLYPAFRHPATVAGLSPLNDQILSGFVAKLTTIAVLGTVAFVTMNGADRHTVEDDDDNPLRWMDVQRELERAERADRRDRRARLVPRPGGVTGGAPPPAPPDVPAPEPPDPPEPPAASGGDRPPS